MAPRKAAERVQPVIHSTFVLERSFPYPPERVFAAFAIAEKKRIWYAGGDNYDVELFELDFRPGGMERLRYRFKEGTPLPGIAITNESVLQDIVEKRRVVWASVMTLGDRRISATLVTIELLPSAEGTEMFCTHQGAFFEGSDGPEMREMGWRTLFDKLAKALETE